MTPIEIAGIVVIGLGSVTALLVAFMNLIVKPVSDLAVIVTRLLAVTDNMSNAQNKLEAKVDSIDGRLDIVERVVIQTTTIA